MFGDKLASGAKSAQFGGPKVSQERWDEIFGQWKPYKKPKKEPSMFDALKSNSIGPLLKTTKKS